MNIYDLSVSGRSDGIGTTKDISIPDLSGTNRDIYKSFTLIVSLLYRSKISSDLY